MSYFKCKNCGHEEHIFSHGGAKETAEKMGIPFLGEIPLNTDIRMKSDSGKPITLEKTEISEPFYQISEKILNSLKTIQETKEKEAPKIIIEN